MNWPWNFCMYLFIPAAAVVLSIINPAKRANMYSSPITLVPIHHYWIVIDTRNSVNGALKNSHWNVVIFIRNQNTRNCLKLWCAIILRFLKTLLNDRLSLKKFVIFKIYLEKLQNCKSYEIGQDPKTLMSVFA